MTMKLSCRLLGTLLGIAGLAMTASASASDKYLQNCVACHGPDLKGVDQLGVNLLESRFVAQKSEAELVEFLKVGRMPDDPQTVTGGAMPGFGWIPESDLQEIANYVKARAGGK